LNKKTLLQKSVLPSYLKIPLARPNDSDMRLKRTKKVRLGIYLTQIRPSDHDILATPGQWLDIAGYPESRYRFWLANWEYGYSKYWNWTVPY